MIQKIIRSISQVLLSAFISFVVLELAARLMGVPPGASRFVETIVIKNHLTPSKAADELRIFTYGESTMYGAHYAPFSSPARWLEAYLKDFLPGKKIRIINFARMGRGIDFTYQTFKSTLPYKPDAAIFYMGHNDFFPNERMDEISAVQDPVKFYAHEWLFQSRLIAFLNRILIRARMERDKNREDKMGYEIIETQLTNIQGAAPTPRNEDFYWENITFFKKTLEKILTLGNQAGVHMLFLKPVSNLKDFAPFQSVHLKMLSHQDLTAWDNHYATGMRLFRQGDLSQALESFHRAYAIDPTYAELSFYMGRIYFKQKNYEKANILFEEAKNNDAIVLRATEEIWKIYETLATERGLALLPTNQYLAPHLEGGIMGEPLFEDNVHFSLKGHSLVGKAIAETMAKQNWLAPENAWQFDRERSFETIGQEFGLTPDFTAQAYVKVSTYFASRFPERIRYAEKAVALAPENSDTLRALAWAYWLAGEKSKATEIYQRLSKIHPEICQAVINRLPELREVLNSKP